MSRDPANRQVNVPLPRGSAMERFYEEEAKAQGVKLPTYWYQLLKDRYEALQGRGQGIWFPRGFSPVSPQPEVPTTPPPSPSKVNAAFQMFGPEDDDESPTEKMHVIT